jgi:hypothetical protein
MARLKRDRNGQAELTNSTDHFARLLVRNWHEGEAEGGAKPVRLCPGSSDVNLLRYGEGIIDFNTEIPDGALDLGMSQQQLHGT